MIFLILPENARLQVRPLPLHYCPMSRREPKISTHRTRLFPSEGRIKAWPASFLRTGKKSGFSLNLSFMCYITIRLALRPAQGEGIGFDRDERKYSCRQK